MFGPAFDPSSLPPPVWVADSQSLSDMVSVLSTQPAFSVDTESNSLFAYRERVCLIQFSTPDYDYVLDPFCFSELNPLAPLFADPQRQKIFHAAEYDILCLKRDYGFEFAGIFDTMVAARTLGWKATGLAGIVESRFGVHLSKKHQRADWGRRPLTKAQVQYARLDTHFLISLRDLQMAELESLGRTEEAHDEFARLAKVESAASESDPHAFWRVKGSRDLTPAEAAVLRELYHYRDHQAERMDRPPFKIMGDQTLIEIARTHPASMRDLEQIHGMTSGQIRRHGAGLVKAVVRGRHAPHPRPPRGERMSAGVRKRYECLQQWRKDKARSRGVESDVILPRDALWTLAHHAPRTLADLDQVDHLGPWRRQTYGPELIDLLNSLPNQP
jgi:ribonuclease D